MLFDHLSDAGNAALSAQDRDHLEDVESRLVLYTHLLEHYFLGHNPPPPAVACRCDLCEIARKILFYEQKGGAANLRSTTPSFNKDQVADQILQDIQSYDEDQQVHNLLLRCLTPAGRRRYLSRIHSRITYHLQRPHPPTPEDRKE